jgi:hypothetical protein
MFKDIQNITEHISSFFVIDLTNRAKRKGLDWNSLNVFADPCMWKQKRFGFVAYIANSDIHLVGSSCDFSIELLQEQYKKYPKELFDTMALTIKNQILEKI